MPISAVFLSFGMCGLGDFFGSGGLTRFGGASVLPELRPTTVRSLAFTLRHEAPLFGLGLCFSIGIDASNLNEPNQAKRKLEWGTRGRLPLR